MITTGREIEGGPGITLLSLSLPEAELTLKRISGEDLDAGSPLTDRLLPPGDVNAWVLLSDPFTIDTEKLVAALAESYPGTPIMGGMASAFPGGRSAYLFEGANLAPGGALLLAVGGAWTVHPVVSQGAAPIGESWTVTEAERNIVVAIGGRPALEVLMETLRDLEPEVQERAGRNLLCGLAMDEYRDELGRGDFLIRNLLGVDRERGAVAINDNVRVGQTLQFQLATPKPPPTSSTPFSIRPATRWPVRLRAACSARATDAVRACSASPTTMPPPSPTASAPCPSPASSATARLAPWAAPPSCTASPPASPSSCPWGRVGKASPHPSEATASSRFFGPKTAVL